MALYEITSENLTKIEQTTFDQAGIRERADLQRLLKKQIEVVLPDTLIVAEEFGEWEESKRRIDLLGLDQVANLVVIELKRTEDGGFMELQAIRYAAMVSTMTFEKIVEIFARYIAQNNLDKDARDTLLTFLGWEEPDEDSFAQDVKIVLVSANFSKELTTAVMWLNRRDLDIRCIRVIPYQDNGRILVDVQQVIPLPEAAEYQIKIREKEQRERKEKTAVSTQHFRFWEELLAVAKKRSNLHDNVSPNNRDAICIKNVRNLKFYHVINAYDGRVEFYIRRSEAATNKRIFDELAKHKDEIEAAFGEPLSWERLDTRIASRLGYYFHVGHKSDESEWPEIHEKMVDAMIRLEKAISPYLSELALMK
jgi:hypothetical protein